MEAHLAELAETAAARGPKRRAMADIADAFPDLASADPALKPRNPWPFRRVLGEMTSADASRLADSLRWGDKRFARKPRAWLERQRDKIPFPRRKR